MNPTADAPLEVRYRILGFLAALLPPLFAVSLTAAYGVNVPFLDEWDMLYLFFLRRRRPAALRFGALFLFLGCYGALSAVLTAVGRAANGALRGDGLPVRQRVDAFVGIGNQPGAFSGSSRGPGRQKNTQAVLLLFPGPVVCYGNRKFSAQHPVVSENPPLADVRADVGAPAHGP